MKLVKRVSVLDIKVAPVCVILTICRANVDSGTVVPGFIHMFEVFSCVKSGTLYETEALEHRGMLRF